MIPSGGFRVSCLYSAMRRRRADRAIVSHGMHYLELRGQHDAHKNRIRNSAEFFSKVFPPLQHTTSRPAGFRRSASRYSTELLMLLLRQQLLSVAGNGDGGGCLHLFPNIVQYVHAAGENGMTSTGKFLNG